jgi:hypothetical protein
MNSHQSIGISKVKQKTNGRSHLHFAQCVTSHRIPYEAPLSAHLIDMLTDLTAIKIRLGQSVNFVGCLTYSCRLLLSVAGLQIDHSETVRTHSNKCSLFLDNNES